jgi:hypothetical protein
MAAHNLIIDITGGNTRNLSISDGTDYGSGDPGHTAADFDTVYIHQILDADGNELSVLSDISGADAGIDTPAETDPVAPANSYTMLADGRHTVKTVAVPTYDNTAAYVTLTNGDVYVYDSGDTKIYKLIQDGTGQQPSSSPTYWEEVITVDITDMASLIAALPSKYVQTDHTYSSLDAEALWADMIYRVHTAQNLVGDDAASILNNQEWKEAAQLFLDLRAWDGQITNANYEAVDDISTRAAALLTKYS